MANRKVCEEIQEAWDMVSAKWSADVKTQYFNKLYIPLLSEAEGIYQRNDELEDYAENCLNSLRV